MISHTKGMHLFDFDFLGIVATAAVFGAHRAPAKASKLPDAQYLFSWSKETFIRPDYIRSFFH